MTLPNRPITTWLTAASASVCFGIFAQGVAYLLFATRLPPPTLLVAFVIPGHILSWGLFGLRHEKQNKRGFWVRSLVLLAIALLALSLPVAVSFAVAQNLTGAADQRDVQAFCAWLVFLFVTWVVAVIFDYRNVQYDRK